MGKVKIDYVEYADMKELIAKQRAEIRSQRHYIESLEGAIAFALTLVPDGEIPKIGSSVLAWLINQGRKSKGNENRKAAKK